MGSFKLIRMLACPQVESTVSNVMLWVLGTAVGGTLGLFAMWSSELAQNPYGLMAVVCAVTFLSGLLIGHQVRKCAGVWVVV